MSENLYHADAPRAFPVQSMGFVPDRGMTLRDYFAAKALGGICSARDESGELIEHGYEWVSRESYRIADAMLKAREQ